MEGYRTEEEQIEAIKTWWSENGTSAVLGVALGLGAIFGWRGWQSHEMEQAEAASALYQQLAGEAQGADTGAARATAMRLLEEYPASSYALFARMTLARLAAESGDYAVAEEQLRAALHDAPGAALGHELRLRLATVLGLQGRPDEALAMLEVENEDAFAAGFEELRGDLFVRKGDMASARSAYQRALSAARQTGMDTRLLETKLDDVGGARES